MTSSMAEVSFLRLPEDDFELEQEDIIAFDPVFPHCSHLFCTDSDPVSFNDHHLLQDHNFILETCDCTGDPVGGASDEILDRENQVTFVMELFQQRLEQSHSLEIETFEFDPILESGFGVVERNVEPEEIGGNCLELEIGEALGLGTDFDRNRDFSYIDDEDDNFSGFVVSDRGDELYVSRRGSENNSGDNSNDGREIKRFSGGLNVVSIGSDSEEDVDDLLVSDLQLEDDYASSSRNDDGNLTLCLDSLQLDDDNDYIDRNDELEWETVGDGSDILIHESSAFMGPENDEVEEMPQLGRARNVEWEVLLNVSNLERNPNLENSEGPYFEDHDGFIYTAEEENEMTFGHFAEGEDALMSRPPASRLVVENLDSVVMKEEDVQNGDGLCAVCKDEMGVGVEVKQLPCSHRYHGDCIVPWLGIRNSCPVCRHELPTDDPDYEQRRTERAAHR